MINLYWGDKLKTNFKDYYKVLQVNRDASQEIIDLSYRTLLKKYSELNGDDLIKANEQLLEINTAYGIIGNPERRKSYNEEYDINNKKFVLSFGSRYKERRAFSVNAINIVVVSFISVVAIVGIFKYTNVFGNKDNVTVDNKNMFSDKGSKSEDKKDSPDNSSQAQKEQPKEEKKTEAAIGAVNNTASNTAAQQGEASKPATVQTEQNTQQSEIFIDSSIPDSNYDKAREISVWRESNSKDVKIYSVRILNVDSTFQIFVDYESSKYLAVSAFNPPNGDQFMKVAWVNGAIPGRHRLKFKMDKAVYDSFREITMKFWTPENENNRSFIGLKEFQGQTTNNTGSRIVDNINYPFVNDPRIIGIWTTVDYIENIDSFKPGVKQFNMDLYLKQMIFLSDGVVKDAPWWTWTKDHILHSGDKTDASYIIKDINGATYMFFQWKSGDYTIRGQKPWYYVLKKN